VLLVVNKCFLLVWFSWLSVSADKWIPVVQVPEAALSDYLNVKRKEGYSVLGLEQTANSVSIDKFVFPSKVVSLLDC
jgi:tRNA guanosine-2'-O-methyltransferase